MKKTVLLLAFSAMLVLVSSVARAQMIGGTPPALAPVEDPGCARASLWEGVGWTGCGLSKGVFAYSHTDLVEPGPLPITLRRTYRSNGGPSVGFGPGWNFDYGIYLYSASEAAGQGFTNVSVVMPDGAQVFCNQISGTTYTNSTFQCTATPDPVWFGATITYDSTLPGFDLVRKDRTLYKFGYNAPLQSITDRNGNTITLVRSGGQTGNITQISDSNGRYINFTYTNGLITQASDALTVKYGLPRTVYYGYDSSGRLTTITDPNGYQTIIGYSTVSGQSDNIASIEDANQNTTTIGYTTTGGSGQAPVGSLSSIGLPDGTAWGFSYTADSNSNILTATITDGLGTQRALVFSAGYVTSDTIGANQSGTLNQVTTFTRAPNTNFITDNTTGACSLTVCHGRRFSFTIRWETC